MSDIRFNTWLHQSGTGGITQVDGGHVGIGRKMGFEIRFWPE